MSVSCTGADAVPHRHPFLAADDYEEVYGHLLSQAKDKVVLHGLGDMFDPNLTGYWGASDFGSALEIVIRIIEASKDKVEGIKISLLDKEKEVILRRCLPDGVLCFTGDDFNYADMIEGDGEHYSNALLGIFDVVAPEKCGLSSGTTTIMTPRYRLTRAGVAAKVNPAK